MTEYFYPVGSGDGYGDGYGSGDGYGYGYGYGYGSGMGSIVWQKTLDELAQDLTTDPVNAL